MEVRFLESDKRIIKAGLWLLRKKLGESASKEAVHDDLVNCGNDAIKELSSIISDAADKIKEKYQKGIVEQLSEIGIWICYKDTAYRDIFFYILNEVLKEPDKFREMIAPYVKEPEKWHVNVWHDSKEFTNKEIQEGKIPNTGKSLAESVHVKIIQTKRLMKLNKNK